MDNKYQSFIDSLNSDGMVKLARSLSKIGDCDFTSCDSTQIESLILSLNPHSPKSISTIRNVICRYAKYIGDNHLCQVAHELDRNAIWDIAKTKGYKKFLSHRQFEDVYHDIGIYEEYNALYYQTLFWCLYEGIYNHDMSVLKNLRAKDIIGNEVTLREDNGNTYKLVIPQQLADNLIELSGWGIWERRGRYETPVKIKLNGIHPDSSFKVERRKEYSETTYYYSYYQKIRKISKEYLEYKLSPLHLYVSGIMYRIRLELAKNNINLKTAFAFRSKDRLVSNIISDELKRCNYGNITIGNFREMVNSYIAVFEE